MEEAMENSDITHINNASAATKTRQTTCLKQEVFIPIKITKLKPKHRTYVMHSRDHYVSTPLSKLLAKAYVMDKRLQQNPELTFREFCRLSNISPRYLSNVLQLNNLSPKLKRIIMEGYQPKHLSVREILWTSFPPLWSEQERWLMGGD